MRRAGIFWLIHAGAPSILTAQLVFGNPCFAALLGPDRFEIHLESSYIWPKDEFVENQNAKKIIGV